MTRKAYFLTDQHAIQDSGCQSNQSTLNFSAEWYAEDFVRQLQLDAEVEQRCERSCLLWSKDHWAEQGKNAQIVFQQIKDRLSDSPENKKNLETLFSDSQFLNTVAQIYAKFFGDLEQFCIVKRFANCPFMGQRWSCN